MSAPKPLSEMLSVIAGYLEAPYKLTEVSVNGCGMSTGLYEDMTLMDLSDINDRFKPYHPNGVVTDFQLHLRDISSITNGECIEIFGEVFPNAEPDFADYERIRYLNQILTFKAQVFADVSYRLATALQKRHFCIHPKLVEMGLATIEPVKEKTT